MKLKQKTLFAKYKLWKWDKRRKVYNADGSFAGYGVLEVKHNIGQKQHPKPKRSRPSNILPVRMLQGDFPLLEWMQEIRKEAPNDLFFVRSDGKTLAKLGYPDPYKSARKTVVATWAVTPQPEASIYGFWHDKNDWDIPLNPWCRPEDEETPISQTV